MKQSSSKKTILDMLHDKHTQPTDEQILQAFDEWITRHPQGGLFECGGRKFSVQPKHKTEVKPIT